MSYDNEGIEKLFKTMEIMGIAIQNQIHIWWSFNAII